MLLGIRGGRASGGIPSGGAADPRGRGRRPPAKAAGNLALVLLALTIWFGVKIIRMRGWLVFSPAFVIGTPLMGLGLVLALLARYVTGVGEFHRRVQESI